MIFEYPNARPVVYAVEHMSDEKEQRATRPPTVDEVTEALRQVIDPEIGMPIVDLGLVYDVKVDEKGTVEVVYTLTSLGCPAGPAIDGQIREILSFLPGVADHKTTIVFQPPWTPEKMNEEAKAALGFF